MKLTDRCPRCGGTITVKVAAHQRGIADTILADALRIHTDSCPSPTPRGT